MLQHDRFCTSWWVMQVPPLNPEENREAEKGHLQTTLKEVLGRSPKADQSSETTELGRSFQWCPNYPYPRYLKTVAILGGRPLRRRTIPGGRGSRTFARLYRYHFLPVLLPAMLEGKGRLWRQLVPFGLNHPHSHRWRRLDRRGLQWERHRQRLVRWGPRYREDVMQRLQRGLPVADRLLPRLYAPLHQRSLEQELASLPAPEWRLRLRQLKQADDRHRAKFRALVWLNRQLLNAQPEVRLDPRRATVMHLVRTRRLVMRRRRVRSYRRRRWLSRRLRRRLVRWGGSRGSTSASENFSAFFGRPSLPHSNRP